MRSSGVPARAASTTARTAARTSSSASDADRTRVRPGSTSGVSARGGSLAAAGGKGSRAWAPVGAVGSGRAAPRRATVAATPASASGRAVTAATIVVGR